MIKKQSSSNQRYRSVPQQGLCNKTGGFLPQFTIYLYILGDIGEGTEDTRAYELPTLDAVLLDYVVGIPYGRGKVILMAVGNEEVLCIIDLGVLVISKANVSSLFSVFLLLLLGEVSSLHLLDKVIRLLSLFCDIEGSGDNVFKGVTLPMAYTLVSGHLIGNDKTVRADETEDTCHDTERGRAIMRIYDNDFGTSFVRGESIEEVTVRETDTVLVVNSGTLPCSDGLGECVSDFITFGTESVNNGGCRELTILLSTASGVRGFKNLRATLSDFLISECEHNVVYPFQCDLRLSVSCWGYVSFISPVTRTLYTIFKFQSSFFCFFFTNF